MPPKAILFDYGQTLVHEISWDPLAGAAALLDCVEENPRKVSAPDLADRLEQVKGDILKEFGAHSRNQQALEVPAAAI